ncbi:MAG TPA: UvrB/UvrC motif-containing protein [Candidatus Latescibacteria bacterium]|nr:UvrB/UvrC motif-containing protein [Candidatus Latescibacterota bacterium]
MGKRVCERCKADDAIVRLISVKENTETVEYLCANCARAEGVEIVVGGKEAVQVLGSGETEEVEQGSREDSVICPGCRLTYARFKERYRLGCAECFDAFRPLLVPLLKKVHGAERHRGKRFARLADEDITSGTPRGTWMLELLKRRLQAAVEREEFEEAARLRDRIEAISKESNVERTAQ